MTTIPKYCIPAIVIASLVLTPGAGAEERDDRGERHSLVLIRTISAEDLHLLVHTGIPVEHFTGSPARGLQMILDKSEMTLLVQTGLPYDILVPDLQEEFRSREPLSPSERLRSRSVMAADRISGFELGSMGGFYTLNEVVTELDSMFLEYPEIMTERSSIGLSHEGRDIWMVKISDNPGENESDTEPVVYYDALHHAREPGSLMTTMYFMYWLLDNYGIDPRATYLVENREFYFVPVVNPDGYAYNELTNPNGGGFWRKNMRPNGGSCVGVDLNRNYSFGYGHDSGSSSDPCASNYRGPSAFSEPEAQAVQGLVSAISPVIAFSTHTFGEKFLNPYGYIEEAPSYQVYSEYSSDFVSGSSDLYGITAEMLGYFSSGTTRDYLHSEGTYAWTPEFGAEGFWPPESTIIPTASENRSRYEYIAWVAGSFADLKNVRFSDMASAGDTVSMTVGIKNRGLTLPSEQVHVSVTTLHPGALPLADNADYSAILPGETVYNDPIPFQFVLTDSAGFLDRIPFVITVLQEGIATALDTIAFTVGTGTVLVDDDAEEGTGLWAASGAGIPWDTTFVDSYDGLRSFADSRYGNSENNTSNYFTLADPVDLVTATHPVMTFAAKWSIEEEFDYARVQVSTNGGVTWLNLPGLYTQTIQGQPAYSGTRHWIREEIDLSAYAGSVVNLRFHSRTDGGVPGDGFYFDCFKIMDYQGSGPTSVASDGPMISGPYLYQNHPNPFNPATRISYNLPATGRVTLKVFDLLGREVTTLVDAILVAGFYRTEWNGRDIDGNDVTSGVYFYRIQSETLIQTRKMVLMR